MCQFGSRLSHDPAGGTSHLPPARGIHMKPLLLSGRISLTCSMLLVPYLLDYILKLGHSKITPQWWRLGVVDSDV